VVLEWTKVVLFKQQGELDGLGIVNTLFDSRQNSAAYHHKRTALLNWPGTARL